MTIHGRELMEHRERVVFFRGGGGILAVFDPSRHNVAKAPNEIKSTLSRPLPQAVRSLTRRYSSLERTHSLSMEMQWPVSGLTSATTPQRRTSSVATLNGLGTVLIIALSTLCFERPRTES